MKVSEFNYELPERLIAQVPIEKRDESKLLVVNRNDHSLADKKFYDVLDILQPGDVLVRNNTKVIPARIFGTKEETKRDKSQIGKDCSERNTSRTANR